jgi:L-aminopeptidase/D-esterase-like protein
MEYVGSGVELVTAVPALGGVGNPDLEAVASGGGAVYWTSTNQEGDFKVGAGFKVVQSTGTIEGETFNRSILSLVTPLTLALE